MAQPTSQKCMYCGAAPDSGGTLHHTADCTLRKMGQFVPNATENPKGPPEGIEHGPFLGAMLRKPDGEIEQRIRNICREEIAQHLEMAKSLNAFAAAVVPPRECEQCKKLGLMLDMARSALVKVAALDPRAAQQRAQMHMPAEHDIARMTLTEIERMEAEGGREKVDD